MTKKPVQKSARKTAAKRGVNLADAIERGPWLVFVDTNILLDFYRSEGEASEVLEKLFAKRESVIVTEQVEWEFKKNRTKDLQTRKAGLAGAGNFTSWRLGLPDRYASEADELESRIKDLRSRAQATIREQLSHPVQNDSVYALCEELFRAESKLHLRHTTGNYYEIVDRADKRFNAGYPPRKDADRTYGDAINWEWIIECASMHEKSSVCIVTRDGDYGDYEKGHPSEWLAQEFSERVPGKKLRLSEWISDALELLEVRVTISDRKAEEAVEADRRAQIADLLRTIELTEQFRRSFELPPASQAAIAELARRAEGAGRLTEAFRVPQYPGLFGYLDAFRPSPDVNPEDE